MSTNLNRSSKLKERRGRNARRRLFRPLRLETLEDRRLMDAGGNTLATATDLGPLQGSRVVSDYVGPADRDDYFRFSVGGQAPVDVRLDQLSADADLTLLNASGGMIRSSAYGGNSPEAISVTLPPGTYYVRVYPYASAATNYRLTLSSTPAAPDYAGNSTSAARDLGMLSGAQTYSDFVGQTDAADWYHFRLATGSEFHLRMDAMTAEADVRLLDSGGRVIGGSYNGGANPEFVDTIIERGDYYLQVYPWGTANTNYQLAITTAPFVSPINVATMTPIPDYAGHVGADYMAPEGSPVLSPVSGRVIAVQPVNGYGTMAVAIEVTLPTSRTFVSELTGTSVTTNRAIVVIGHLRASRNLVASQDASYRFNTGSGELGYRVGDTISVGQRLGYLEARDYNGSPEAPHAHVTISNAVNPPPNYWQGRGLSETDLLRARYIRPELAWSLLR